LTEGRREVNVQHYDVTGYSLPYVDIAVDGHIYRIGKAGRRIIAILVPHGGTMARSDLASALGETPRGETGHRYSAIRRLIDDGKPPVLRVGAERTATSRHGRKAAPVELTEVGWEIARRLGMASEREGAEHDI
jgi:hypothetical protein